MLTKPQSSITCSAERTAVPIRDTFLLPGACVSRRLYVKPCGRLSKFEKISAVGQSEMLQKKNYHVYVIVTLSAHTRSNKPSNINIQYHQYVRALYQLFSSHFNLIRNTENCGCFKMEYEPLSTLSYSTNKFIYHF